jgi:hypothetical protein
MGETKLRTTACEVCGTTFTHYPSVDPGRFCSRACHAIAKNPAMRRDLLTEAHLRQRYEIDGWSTYRIADELRTSKTQITRYMRRFGIQTRKNLGRAVGKGGYILIKSPGHPHANALGYVREHRLVLERVLGRYLLPSEVVHHKNGVKDDNRPENLELFESNGVHMRLHVDSERSRAAQAKGNETKRRRVRARLKQERYCACGCGERIVLTERHIPSQLPRFKRGHHMRTRTAQAHVVVPAN